MPRTLTPIALVDSAAADSWPLQDGAASTLDLLPPDRNAVARETDGPVLKGHGELTALHASAPVWPVMPLTGGGPIEAAGQAPHSGPHLLTVAGQAGAGSWSARGGQDEQGMPAQEAAFEEAAGVAAGASHESRDRSVLEETGSAADDVAQAVQSGSPKSAVPGESAIINGTPGDDTLIGTSGDDVLDGLAGADLMIGGAGNDVYIVDNVGDLVREIAGEGIDRVESSVSRTLEAQVENLTLTATASINGTGNELENTIIGNGGANTLAGLDGNDSLNGGGGNDTLDGGTGADTMAGGSGNDIYKVDNVGDVLTELPSEGTDRVNSSISWTLGENFENLTLTGPAPINGTGNAVANTITGNSGINTLAGRGGNDVYVVGAGDTVTELAGEGTADRVESSVTWVLGAEVENLTLTGTAAINGSGNGLNNVIIGNTAANVLDGLADADTMTGGAGNDVYRVDSTGDVVNELASEGTDRVESTISYTLGSNVENLTLKGSAAINGSGNSLKNVIIGNSAANILDGLAGADTMTGGAGNDVYRVDSAGDVVNELASEGTDRVESMISYTLGSDVENLTLLGSAAINGTGNSLSNVLLGNSSANTLSGLEGNDTLDGKGGADNMIGGLGNDVYRVDNAGVVITELADEGTDRVESTISYTLGGNVENLTLKGSAAINGSGNSLKNVIIGNTAANVLDGLADADTMTGGAGNDVYRVDSTGDVVNELASEGTDRVESTISYTLGSNVENLTLKGSAAINGSGNSLKNVIIGNSAANILDGLADADTMTGGAGNDVYRVDSTGDVVNELASEGTDRVESTISYTLGSDVENLTLLGSAAINGTGNSLSNLLLGNSSANTLSGLEGNDTLDGKGGADSMIGGLGNDVYRVDNAGVVITELADEGTDRVESTISYTLGGNVENLTLKGSAAINGSGNSLKNVIIGNTAANVLDGLADADTMTGGAGNDVYRVDSTGDVVNELASEGTDRVESTISYTLGSNVENLTLKGSAAINGSGNSLKNVIIGNTAASILDGLAGADTMTGGAGNDVYRVDSTGDVVNELASEGTDRVESTISYTLGSNVENLTLLDSAAINGTGNELDNVLYASVGDNVLNGLAGNDTVSYLYGTTSGVTVKLSSTAPQATGGSGTETLLNVENLTGSSYGDMLTGANGNNVVDGGAGNDILDGLGGSDSVLGGAGNDLGIYQASQNVGKSDLYDGGTGDDRLRLLFTHGELNTAAVQNDIGAFRSFIATNRNTGTDAGPQFQFTAIGLKAADWEDLELVDTSGMVWQKGTAPVTIGSASARTSFTIGTNAAPAAGDRWTGAAIGGNDNWSVADNWLDISPPTPVDRVVFDGTDAGGRSRVDPAFQGTIAGLVDTGEASHTLEVNRTLQVNGPVAVHTANAQQTGALTVFDTQVVLHLTDLSVGRNDAGSGNPVGYLFLNKGAVLDASDVGTFGIGKAGNGAAIGAVILAGGSTLTLGTVAAPAVALNIGWNYTGSAAAFPVGVFDALQAGADVQLHVSAINVGYGVGADGTLKWNQTDQTEAIDADEISFGRGGGAVGRLEVPAGGTLQLGTAADPVGTLRIADNNGGGGTARATLDFSIANPNFTAYLGNYLIVGATYSGSAEGKLVLGSNSNLTLGTVAAPAVALNIGWNYTGNGAALPVGVFDALQAGADVQLHVSAINVGYGVGADGTFKWNQTEAIDADEISFARGGGAVGRLEVPAGGTFQLGTAADPIGILRIADNSGGGGTARATLDFSIANPNFTAYLGNYLIVGATYSGSAEGKLVLGSNSNLTLGTVAAPAVALNIGWNYTGNGAALPVGVFDALQAGADVQLHVSAINVGYGVGADGTFKWNQTEAIDADEISFGRGGGAVGRLEVPAGGTLQLGTAADPVGTLRIADNNGGGGTARATLDFSIANPNFTAYLGNYLIVGATYSGSAEGKLVLGSNSNLTLGTVAAPAVALNIGWNYTGNGAALPVGVFDALQAGADVQLHVGAINVGYGVGTLGVFLAGSGVNGDATSVNVGTSGAGATGLFDILGASLDATTLNLASGGLDFHTATIAVSTTGSLSTNTLNLSGGLLTGQTLSLTDGTLNFTGGALSVNTVNGALVQNGGTLLPGISPSETTVNGNYSMASAATLRIDLFGSTFSGPTKQYERLSVNGSVNLNSDAGTGGKLDLHLGYSPTVGTAFNILSNDGTDAISSRFAGLLNGATFNVAYGTQTVTFQISYAAGSNGNDIVLTTKAVSGAAPSGLTVIGTGGNDILTGSVANDVITGAAGNDVLFGAGGNDTFVFASGFGSDRIRDFTVGQDLVKLGATTGITNFAGLDTNGNGVLDNGDSAVHIAGPDTLIVLGSNLIDIVGQTSLHASDFVFDSGSVAGASEMSAAIGAQAASGSHGPAASSGADTFVITQALAGCTIAGFASGTDKILIGQSGFAVGDGDSVVEGAVTRAAPGGFETSAEVVVMTANIDGAIDSDNAAAAIGSATSAYATGQTALFMVDNGSDSALYYFSSQDTDAAVEANELTLLASLTGTASSITADLIFGG